MHYNQFIYVSFVYFSYSWKASKLIRYVQLRYTVPLILLVIVMLHFSSNKNKNYDNGKSPFKLHSYSIWTSLGHNCTMKYMKRIHRMKFDWDYAWARPDGICVAECERAFFFIEAGVFELYWQCEKTWLYIVIPYI